MTSQPHDPTRPNAPDPGRQGPDTYGTADPGPTGPDRDTLSGSDRDNPRDSERTQVIDPSRTLPDRYDTAGPGAMATDQQSVRTREKEAFGGIKVGSAFFGWLTTIGATILLVALVTAVAAGIGIDTNVSSQDLRGVGIGVAIALLVILFVAYFVGGYVAGRMARFNGARQGLAVWLWAVLVAIILTVVGVIADQQSDITSQVNLPAFPVSSGDLTADGLIALAIVLAVTLAAAILGGLAGMRFHRRVDRAGFDTSRDDAQLDQPHS